MQRKITDFIPDNSKILITGVYGRVQFVGGICESIPSVSVKAMVRGECVEEIPITVCRIPKAVALAKINAIASILMIKYSLNIQSNLRVKK